MYDSFDNTYQVGATAGTASEYFVSNDQFGHYWSVSPGFDNETYNST